MLFWSLILYLQCHWATLKNVSKTETPCKPKAERELEGKTQHFKTAKDLPTNPMKVNTLRQILLKYDIAHRKQNSTSLANEYVKLK